jgi:exopolysaccharide biosynthesis polyprenyl glycosylphosphotransferase
MGNHSVATFQWSETPVDLRAPTSVKLRKGSWWLRLITLVIADYSLLLLAWKLAEFYTSNHYFYFFRYGESNNLQHTLAAISMQVGSLALQGNYRSGKKRYDYLNIAKSLTFAHGLILFVCFLYKPTIEITRSILIFSWLLSILNVCVGRFIINIILEYLRQQKLFGCSYAFVIYDTEDKEKAISSIQKEKRYIIRGTAPAKCLDRSDRQQTLERLSQLNVTEVFISWDAIKNRMFVCWLFQAYGISVHLFSMQAKPIYRTVEFTNIGGMNYLTLSCPILPGTDFLIKRTMDLLGATLFLTFSFPIYIAIAIAIKLDSPGPVFFKQTRIGLHGKPFQLWKFRTMRADAEKLQKELETLNETKDGILFKIKDDPRITRVGKFLRRYSLDELPQLFNVLRGEMSLVGPRPLPVRDVDKFSEHHFIRHEVLPGITGLWQVSGRSNITDFEQVISLDLTYIENWSLKLDLEILLKTFMVILQKQGAY